MTINFDKKTLLGYIIEGVILIAILAFVWGWYSDKLNDSEQNLRAMKGRVELVELQNGELLNARDSYVASINDLEELLAISKQQVKSIQRQLDSKVAYIAKLEQDTKIEYVEVVKDSIVYVDNDTKRLIASFHYEDEWLSLNGENEFDFTNDFNYKTALRNIKMNAPLTVGLTNDYKIFVTTSNPYVSFGEIDGAVIDNSVIKPRKKRFGWGLHGGIGVMYDVIDKDIAVGPTASFGVHINF